MKYMGSKAKYAKQLLVAISENCNLSEYENWVEPFVGGANMIAEVANMVRWGNDINPYIIEMFKAIQNGWFPPTLVTEEDYEKIKENKDVDTALTGYVGFALSFGGKWFGGYRRDVAGTKGNIENMKTQSRRAYESLLKQKPFIQDVIFSCQHYKNMYIPKTKSIIYCDPPYAMTTKYKEQFESDKFWDWCNEMAQRGHKVFVSEYQAPEGWRCIWEKVVNSSLTKETGSKQATERLFTK